MCGIGPAVDHSTRIDTSSIVFGKVVEYHCDTGHSVDGKVGGLSSWVTTCLGNNFSVHLTCEPISCSLLSIEHTRVQEGVFLYEEVVGYECLDGYRVGGMASGNASLDVKCGADGTSIQLGSCSPASCGQPTSVSNSFVDIREYVLPEEASYTCSRGYTTTGVPSGVTSFTRACEANGNFSTGHECPAVSCEVSEDAHGARSPAGEILFPGSESVTCNECDTTDSGNVHGATSYSMTRTASRNLSFTSDGCGLFDPMEEIHYSVSDGSRCTGNACCAGYPRSLGLTFPCGNADLSETGCETSINYNLYNSSITHVTLDYDEMTESV